MMVVMVAADGSSAGVSVWADIYWGGIIPTGEPNRGVFAQLVKWKPWALMLHPYMAPTDPLHVTFYYDREDDLTYQQAFNIGVEH